MAKRATPPSRSRLNRPRLTVRVTGDIFIEQYIWPTSFGGRNLPYLWPDELRSCEATTTFSELSGAPLHADIFKAMLEAWGFSVASAIDIKAVPLRDKLERLATAHEDSPFPVYLHELEPFPLSDDSKPFDKEKVWRISRTYGELRPSRPLTRSDPTGLPNAPGPLLDALRSLEDDVANWLVPTLAAKNRPTVVVINDRNALKDQNPATSIRSMFESIQSRIDPKHGLRPADPANLLILWHTRSPIFRDNPLAAFLSQPDFARITIPIVNYHCLQDDGVPLRFDVSYESSIGTILSSRNTGVIESLCKFPHALIRFDYGVMHLSSVGNKLSGLDIHGLNAGPYGLVPSRHGIVLGTTPLLIASILREIGALVVNQHNSSLADFLDMTTQVRHPTIRNNTVLDRAIDVALLLANIHFRRGFGRVTVGEAPDRLLDTTTVPLYEQLVSEFRSIGKLPALSKPFASEPANLSIDRVRARGTGIERLTRMSIPNPAQDAAGTDDSQSRIFLLSEQAVMCSFLPDSLGSVSPESCFDSVLHGIVEQGLARVLSDGKTGQEPAIEPSVVCPYVAFGQYLTVDRDDIDSFLAVRNLVDKYLSYKSWTSPLAIAVFGRPGSGKSRIVREVLESIPMCRVDPALECNMSQWSSVESLTRHFHKIQDRTAHDQTPVVFFDEFDSYLGGEPVGWLKYFLMPLQDGLYVDGTDTFHIGKSVFVFAGGVAHSFKEFHDAFKKRPKVNDFISRLRGTIDVHDISFRVDNEADLSGLLRKRAQIKRAVLLRALLKIHLGQVFESGSELAQIDKSITDAFLGVRHFYHGVRSMEAIVQMSRVPPRASTFTPAALPPIAQLRIHMGEEDAELFLQTATKPAGRTRVP